MAVQDASDGHTQTELLAQGPVPKHLQPPPRVSQPPCLLTDSSEPMPPSQTPFRNLSCRLSDTSRLDFLFLIFSDSILKGWDGEAH